MGCNLPCDPECKNTLGNQGRPCMPAWGALGRRPWAPPHGAAVRVPRGGREVSSVGGARVLAKAPTVDARAGLRSVPRRYLDVPTVR